MYKNYIVLKEDATEGESSYEMKMVTNNRIAGFLEAEIRFIDERREYYYDITEKQPISVLYRKESLREEQIRNILTEIIRTLQRGREYLLSENSFVLRPEYIYMSMDERKVGLIYFSAYQERIHEQLISFIEYMMDRVDYKDKSAVFLVYGIYKISREESCTFDKLLEFLQDNGELEEELQEQQLKEKTEWEEEEAFLDREEEIEGEEEKKKYPFWVWLGCTISVLAALAVIVIAVKLGVVFDLATGELLVGKMAVVFGIVGALEAYCLMRLLDEKNRMAYIVKRTDYIKPVEEKRKWDGNTIFTGTEEKRKRDDNTAFMGAEEKGKWDGDITFTSAEEIEGLEEKVPESCTDLEREASMEMDQPTVILAERKTKYYLKPEQNDVYIPIYIVEFPFFVGTLKTKVDCVINSRSVSRFHAKLLQEEEHFYLVDLNSTNGTFVNGERVSVNQKTEIVLGDTIAFADVRYQFCRDS